MKSGNWNIRFVIIVQFFLTAFGSAFTQNRALQYTIWQKDSPIGTIHFSETANPSRKILRLESSLTPKALISLSISATEESIFEENIMTSSSVYRCVNDKEKINMIIRRHGNEYQVHKGDDVEILQSTAIRFNMICMYAREPHDVSLVYSDIFQKYLSIERLAQQHYKIRFPDGNYNEYFYQNGIIKKIEVHNRLYNATIEHDESL